MPNPPLCAHRLRTALDGSERQVRAMADVASAATHAPTRSDQVTLDYFMLDYVDHLEMHLRQILGVRWSSSSGEKQ